MATVTIDASLFLDLLTAAERLLQVCEGEDQDEAFDQCREAIKAARETEKAAGAYELVYPCES